MYLFVSISVFPLTRSSVIFSEGPLGARNSLPLSHFFFPSWPRRLVYSHFPQTRPLRRRLQLVHAFNAFVGVGVVS
ncbi:hypothetical protein DFJ73DRAFT_849321 [Zopfochytrium polystomum]|nr:hypothetical protein DFJ73DRAFT_849321 [Zopfochytrium polystomum]